MFASNQIVCDICVYIVRYLALSIFQGRKRSESEKIGDRSMVFYNGCLEIRLYCLDVALAERMFMHGSAICFDNKPTVCSKMIQSDDFECVSTFCLLHFHCIFSFKQLVPYIMQIYNKHELKLTIDDFWK